ncbi:MAG: universal stress protein [Bacteroidota bacterium]
MSTIKRILVPFDFSESAINALDYTLNFADMDKAMDVLALKVSVAPVTSAQEKEDEEQFRKILDTLHRKTKKQPKFLSVSGNLIETLLKIQVEQHIDLTIMGTMGDKDADEALTNTSRLTLESKNPVIAIPYKATIDLPKKIAFVLGKEEIESPRIIGVLLDIARIFDAKVHVLTIYKDSVYDEKAINDNIEKILEYYLEHFYAEHSFSKNEDIEQGILDYVEKKDIDLLVILPRNHVQKTAPSEGRLTKLLMMHSDVPVLTLD